MFQITKMNPNWEMGIISPTTTYSRVRTNPLCVLLMRAMIAIITTRNRGNATTTVTNDSASMPRVSMRFRISRRSSFSNCSAFIRKYGFSCPPEVEVVTTPWRKSWNFELGERPAAFRIAERMSTPSSSVSRVIHSASFATSPYTGCFDSSLKITSTGTSALAMAEMNDIEPVIFLSTCLPRFFAMPAGLPLSNTGTPKYTAYASKPGTIAMRANPTTTREIDALSTKRKRARKKATATALTAAIVVFSHAIARYSSGRSLIWARSRLSSKSWFSLYRACTNPPNVRQANSCQGLRATETGFAPFGSRTRRWVFCGSSPVRNRFVFVRVRRVSSFPNAVLANRLASGRFRGPPGFADPAHLVADLLRGLVGVLVVRDHDLRDLSEVDDVPLAHVVDDIDPPLEFRLHLLV